MKRICTAVLLATMCGLSVRADEAFGKNPNSTPVGLSYMFDNAPVDVFVEIAPAIDVAPDVQGEITGGIGIRYWF